MRTVYVDHAILAEEAWWEHLRRAVKSKDFHLALSVWNLYEIGKASDDEQRERRLALLDELCPVWMVERRDIQRQELKRFLWTNKFKVSAPSIFVITPALSVVQSFFAGSRTQVGLTARQFIRETDFKSIRPFQRLSRDALATLQAAERTQLQQRSKMIFVAWLNTLIPDCGPDGRALSSSSKADLLEFCWNNKALLLSQCKCLAMEDVLSTIRVGDVGRKPTDSDCIDLQHATLALPFCDIFVVIDKYVRQCSQIARNRLKTLTLARVCSQPAALEAAATMIMGGEAASL